MKYRKKPVVVDAFRLGIDALPDWFVNKASYKLTTSSNPMSIECVINTLEGAMTAGYGDYIIKGVKGEFYPCKADIFEQTYEKVEDKCKE